MGDDTVIAQQPESHAGCKWSRKERKIDIKHLDGRMIKRRQVGATSQESITRYSHDEIADHREDDHAENHRATRPRPRIEIGRASFDVRPGG